MPLIVLYRINAVSFIVPIFVNSSISAPNQNCVVIIGYNLVGFYRAIYSNVDFGGDKAGVFDSKFK